MKLTTTLKAALATAILVTSMSSFALGITLSPLATATRVVQMAIATAVSPFVFTTAGSANNNREIFKAVRNDSLDFLANGQKTEKLEASLSELKKEESLAGKSDVELAALIVATID